MAYNSAEFKALLVPAFVLALFIGTPFAISPQTPDDTRGLKPREYAQVLQKKITAKRPQSNRHRSRPPAKYVSTASDTTLVAEGVDIGVILWRLREAQKADDLDVVEEKRIVKRKKGKDVESTVKMIAARVESEAQFVEGDFFRLSFEVFYENFIYILNQEQYVSGEFSEPYLVFPSKVDIGGSAKAAPGKLIYIPNETDYFEISSLIPSGAKKRAELFTVLLTKEPIQELPPLEKGEEYRKIDRKLLDRWQSDWGATVTKFERQSGVGAAITKAEKKSGVSGGEFLTQDDPEPQTVYHVARKMGDPLLFKISISMRGGETPREPK